MKQVVVLAIQVEAEAFHYSVAGQAAAREAMPLDHAVRQLVEIALRKNDSTTGVRDVTADVRQLRERMQSWLGDLSSGVEGAVDLAVDLSGEITDILRDEE